jgi:hypothetical protein
LGCSRAGVGSKLTGGQQGLTAACTTEKPWPSGMLSDSGSNVSSTWGAALPRRGWPRHCKPAQEGGARRSSGSNLGRRSQDLCRQRAPETACSPIPPGSRRQPSRLAPTCSVGTLREWQARLAGVRPSASTTLTEATCGRGMGGGEGLDPRPVTLLGTLRAAGRRSNGARRPGAHKQGRGMMVGGGWEWARCSRGGGGGRGRPAATQQLHRP